ncbi:MAG TPA: cache domain-containing protein [Chitinophagaceae bacterium]|nr:cache domain-containing protein [Chitinophagaceae bacterium]
MKYTLLFFIFLMSCSNAKREQVQEPSQPASTEQVVALVKDAAKLVQDKGEEAFAELRKSGSRWRQGETYVFVLDSAGDMLVHPDPELEGKNKLDLKDVNGKPIVEGLISAATALPGKPEGWYHYEWPVPGGILPRWKSTYVHQVNGPDGKSYIVGCGVYNDRMEKEFITDMVKDAVGLVEKNDTDAYKIFHDPANRFMAKDAYIFVVDTNGLDLVNPGFPSLEGRNLMDVKDTQGKLLIREMFQVVKASGSGWVNYMWPKPGETASTQKSSYVSRAQTKNGWVLVGCGAYLADAPRAAADSGVLKATELMALVRDAAKVFEQKGEKAYPEFRQKGSKWFRGNTYFFVWTTEGKRVFHAADPSSEGKDVRDLKDVLSKPFGAMMIGAANSLQGEGWVHYMWPEPNDIFPTWKSSFVKKVSFPNGKPYLIGCGIYNMQMDKAFIEDVVNRAADLVTAKGREAFGELRDKKGPYLFMDVYVFVDDPNGVELVNPAQPSIEGKNVMDLKDAKGKLLAKEYIDAAMNKGNAWVDYYWYKPGSNVPALKHTFVRKVTHGGETFILGAGFYENGE